MIQCVETGKAKKINPYVHNYNNAIEIERNGKMIFSMKFEQIGDKIFITEVPKGYDAARIYRHLNKFIEKDFIKDYIDSTVDNDINIELIFKRGKTPTLSEVQQTMAVSSSLTPNYTLISERGVKIFSKVQEIIEIFTQQRLDVVKRRYELLCEEYQTRINQNSEVIRFIKEKQYEVATKTKNRKTFVEHLKSKKYQFFDYLADMPIYRMTKEEVAKRTAMVKDDKAALKEFQKIAKSPKLIKAKLIEELKEVKVSLDQWLKDKKREREQLRKKIEKKNRKKKK
jgi:DNA gyrase subunit A